MGAYEIMVSEIMLQQTQVPRVIEKYKQFLEAFPTIADLAKAPLQDVLFVWQGLGYNRRGRFLREAAVMVEANFKGSIPSTLDDLVTLPGIGRNTASAILVYAYNQPLVFIETNIRSVYLHHFWPDNESVTDADILRLVAETLDTENPREWYWALMDYGTHIKKTHGNPNVRSKHYNKQSAFQGSKRQVRGAVLRALTADTCTIQDLKMLISDERLELVLQDLVKEQLIQQTDGKFMIAA